MDPDAMAEGPLNRRRVDAASRCLDALGERWRADWSDFDGRTLRAQLAEINGVLRSGSPEERAAEFCAEQREAMG